MRAMLAHAGGDSVQVAFWPFLMLAVAQRHNALYTFATTPPAIPIVLASDGRLTRCLSPSSSAALRLLFSHQEVGAP